MNNRLTEGQRELVAAHVGLAVYVARKLRRLDTLKLADLQDAVQEAALATCLAVQSHDPERGAPLPSYIRICAWRRLVSFRRHLELVGMTARRVNPGDGWEAQVAAPREPDDAGDREEVLRWLDWPGLTGREQQALRAYYLD